MRYAWIAGLIVLSWPAAALAQDAQASEQRIEVAFERAASAGIPLSLLEEKVAEGKARGETMNHIADAVEHRLEGLTRARAALSRGGADVTADEMSAGADAIGVGVSTEALETIAATAPQDRRLVAINVLTELYYVHNIPVGEALVAVQDALARGPGALENLPAQARAGQRPPVPEAARRGRPAWAGPPAWLGGRPSGGAARPAVPAGRP